MKLLLVLKGMLLKPFWARSVQTQRLIVTGALFLVLYFLLVMAVSPTRVEVEEGRPSPKDIYAHRAIVDEYTTEKLAEEAAEEVAPVYTYQEEVTDNIIEELDYFFNHLVGLNQEYIEIEEGVEVEEEFDDLGELEELEELEEAEDKQELLKKELEQLISQYPDLLKADISVLLLKDPEIIEELGDTLREDVYEFLEEGVKPDEKEEVLEELSEKIWGYPYSQEVLRLTEKLAHYLVEPNLIYDAAATEEKREEARNEVKEDPVRIPQNALIVQEGETVTSAHVYQLEELGRMRGGQLDYPSFIGLFMLLLIFFGAVGTYLYVMDRSIYEDYSLLLLLGIIVIITLVFAIAAGYFSEFLVPVAMGVILLAVLFNNYLAILINTFLAVIVGLISDGDIMVIIVTLIGGLVAIYSVSRISQRMDLVRAGFYVAAVNVLVIIAGFLLLGDLRLEYGIIREFSYSLFAGAGNGIFSAVVAIGLLPFLESGFGLTTSVTLLELSNPNQPLLKKLMMKAPGTYHHSVLVGNLAEAAAEEVKAEPLLVRVGAYYHDIGKINRPYFFVENQFSRENPHKKLSPNLSALIISAHVKEGVEMAQNEGLPAEVIDIIREHHGNSQISFFYQQALENGRKDVSEKNFRYEGPSPQSREAAIIMLADAVEAAVRSLSRPVGSRIEGMVRKIIKEKLNDGQLDECDLTLRDLDKIGDTFVHILSCVYHTRLEYPEKEIKAEIEGKGRQKV